MAQLASALITPTEREFTAQVLQLAHTYGWLTCHFRPLRRLDGTWRTPLQGDGAGFPDLVLVRGDISTGRCLFIELKTDHGRLSPLQRRWFDALHSVQAVEAYVFDRTTGLRWSRCCGDGPSARSKRGVPIPRRWSGPRSRWRSG